MTLNWMTRCARIVILITLAIALKPRVVTSVTTSVEKLRILSKDGDTKLVKGIEDTISENLELIRNLTTMLAQYSKTEVFEHKLQAEHPNDFYLLVKSHIETWYFGNIQEDLLPALENIIKERNITFPKEVDYDDAALGLIRLQNVYKLKSRDMFEGNYMGYMGSPLTTDDAYLLGKRAFEVGKLPECIEWLELAAELQKAEAETQAKNGSGDGQMSEDDLFIHIKTLSLLGRAHLYANDTKKAWELYEQCKESGEAESEDLKELLKELEAENITKLQEDYSPDVRDIDDNITQLCSRGKEQRVPALLPYHMCRYKVNALIPYQRFQEEILSTSPYASLFYDVIYDAEIERLRDIAIKQGISRGLVGGGTDHSRTSDVRTGDLGWVDDNEDPLVARVSQRVKAFTGLDVTQSNNPRLGTAEKMQVVNYGIGGHYDVHLDALAQNTGRYNDRLATVLFYLTEVEKGGATIFPKVGISVTPVKGMALLWYSYPPNLKAIDDETLHAGCPVMFGNKWIANKWVWTNGNMFRRPCGPSPDSSQLDVEQVVTMESLTATVE